MCPYRWRGSLVTAGPDQGSGWATGWLGSLCSQPLGLLAPWLTTRRAGVVPRNPEDTEEGSVRRRTGHPWGPSGALGASSAISGGSWRESTQ